MLERNCIKSVGTLTVHQYDSTLKICIKWAKFGWEQKLAKERSSVKGDWAVCEPQRKSPSNIPYSWVAAQKVIHFSVLSLPPVFSLVR